MGSLVPRPLPDFISQLWRKIEFLHSCEIKSGSGLGTRLEIGWSWTKVSLTFEEQMKRERVRKEEEDAAKINAKQVGVIES